MSLYIKCWKCSDGNFSSKFILYKEKVNFHSFISCFFEENFWSLLMLLQMILLANDLRYFELHMPVGHRIFYDSGLLFMKTS